MEYNTIPNATAGTAILLSVTLALSVEVVADLGIAVKRTSTIQSVGVSPPALGQRFLYDEAKDRFPSGGYFGSFLRHGTTCWCWLCECIAAVRHIAASPSGVVPKVSVNHIFNRMVAAASGLLLGTVLLFAHCSVSTGSQQSWWYYYINIGCGESPEFSFLALCTYVFVRTIWRWLTIRYISIAEKDEAAHAIDCGPNNVRVEASVNQHEGHGLEDQYMISLSCIGKCVRRILPSIDHCLQYSFGQRFESAAKASTSPEHGSDLSVNDNRVRCSNVAFHPRLVIFFHFSYVSSQLFYLTVLASEIRSSSSADAEASNLGHKTISHFAVNHPLKFVGITLCVLSEIILVLFGFVRWMAVRAEIGSSIWCWLRWLLTKRVPTKQPQSIATAAAVPKQNAVKTTRVPLSGPNSLRGANGIAGGVAGEEEKERNNSANIVDELPRDEHPSARTFREREPIKGDGLATKGVTGATNDEDNNRVDMLGKILENENHRFCAVLMVAYVAAWLVEVTVSMPFGDNRMVKYLPADISANDYDPHFKGIWVTSDVYATCLAVLGAFFVLVLTAMPACFMKIDISTVEALVAEVKARSIRYLSHELRTPMNTIHMGLAHMEYLLEAVSEEEDEFNNEMPFSEEDGIEIREDSKTLEVEDSFWRSPSPFTSPHSLRSRRTGIIVERFRLGDCQLRRTYSDGDLSRHTPDSSAVYADCLTPPFMTTASRYGGKQRDSALHRDSRRGSMAIPLTRGHSSRLSSWSATPPWSGIISPSSRRPSGSPQGNNVAASSSLHNTRGHQRTMHPHRGHNHMREHLQRMRNNILRIRARERDLQSVRLEVLMDITTACEASLGILNNLTYHDMIASKKLQTTKIEVSAFEFLRTCLRPSALLQGDLRGITLTASVDIGMGDYVGISALSSPHYHCVSHCSSSSWRTLHRYERGLPHAIAHSGGGILGGKALGASPIVEEALSATKDDEQHDKVGYISAHLHFRDHCSSSSRMAIAQAQNNDTRRCAVSAPAPTSSVANAKIRLGSQDSLHLLSHREESHNCSSRLHDTDSLLIDRPVVNQAVRTLVYSTANMMRQLQKRLSALSACKEGRTQKMISLSDRRILEECTNVSVVIRAARMSVNSVSVSGDAPSVGQFSQRNDIEKSNGKTNNRNTANANNADHGQVTRKMPHGRFRFIGLTPFDWMKKKKSSRQISSRKIASQPSNSSSSRMEFIYPSLLIPVNNVIHRRSTVIPEAPAASKVTLKENKEANVPTKGSLVIEIVCVLRVTLEALAFLSPEAIAAAAEAPTSSSSSAFPSRPLSSVENNKNRKKPGRNKPNTKKIFDFLAAELTALVGSRDKVFEFNPNNLRSEGGSGLSMSIARGIIELHDGTVSSKPAVGRVVNPESLPVYEFTTTIVITLPVTRTNKDIHQLQGMAQPARVAQPHSDPEEKDELLRRPAPAEIGPPLKSSEGNDAALEGFDAAFDLKKLVDGRLKRSSSRTQSVAPLVFHAPKVNTKHNIVNNSHRDGVSPLDANASSLSPRPIGQSCGSIRQPTAISSAGYSSTLRSMSSSMSSAVKSLLWGQKSPIAARANHRDGVVGGRTLDHAPPSTGISGIVGRLPTSAAISPDQGQDHISKKARGVPVRSALKGSKREADGGWDTAEVNRESEPHPDPPSYTNTRANRTGRGPAAGGGGGGRRGRDNASISSQGCQQLHRDSGTALEKKFRSQQLERSVVERELSIIASGTNRASLCIDRSSIDALEDSCEMMVCSENLQGLRIIECSNKGEDGHDDHRSNKAVENKEDKGSGDTNEAPQRRERNIRVTPNIESFTLPTHRLIYREASFTRHSDVIKSDDAEWLVSKKKSSSFRVRLTSSPIRPSVVEALNNGDLTTSILSLPVDGINDGALGTVSSHKHSTALSSDGNHCGNISHTLLSNRTSSVRLPSSRKPSARDNVSQQRIPKKLTGEDKPGDPTSPRNPVGTTTSSFRRGFNDAISPAISSRPSRRGMGLSILIVDDSALTRKMTRRLLTSYGHECDEAEDGMEAVVKVLHSLETPSTADDACNKRDITLTPENTTIGALLAVEEPVKKVRYDVILMDFVMPNMNGPSATAELRRLGYDGLIIGLTGNMLPSDIAHFIAQGATKVLIKPLRIEDINAALSVEDGVPSCP